MIRRLLGRVYRQGYLAGVSAADREWAAMLENHMVGPGAPNHPTRGLPDVPES